MEIFKGVQTHTQNVCSVHQGLSSGQLPLCVSVHAYVVCASPLSGLEVDGADLLGRTEEKKGSEKPIKGKITCVSVGVSLRASHS